MKPVSQKEEIQIAINVLATAYRQAPNIIWMFKPTAKNRKLFFTSVVKDAAAKKGVYLTENRKGVLIIYDQSTKVQSFSSVLRKVWLLISVFGINKGLKVMKQQKWQASHRPTDGLYALALAVSDDPDKWQTRLELKKGFSYLVRQSTVPIYAETTNPRILKLYENLGFECYHQMAYPYAELTIWFLKKC